MSRHFSVVIRCRPSAEEKAWKEEGNSLQLVGEGRRRLSFDRILTEADSHADLYERAVSPVMESALSGRNAFVVVYGLPRSGKTHVVFGSAGPKATPEDRGLVGRCGQQVFRSLSASSVRLGRVSATFCQLFEDGRVADLLDSRGRQLDVVEKRPGAASSVAGLTEHAVGSPSELARLTEKANLLRNASGCVRQPSAGVKRAAASPTPSQPPYKQHCSHAVVTLTVEWMKAKGKREEKAKEGKERNEEVLSSQITIVDLAGHSIALALAGQPCPDGGMEELHQVMSALPPSGTTAVSSLSPHSSLTKLLRQAFGGNCESILIGTVSLCETAVEGTGRCLQLLQGMDKIQNCPCLPSTLPLAETALGRTLQQIEELKKKTCEELGAPWPVRSWEVRGKELVLDGHSYTELSVSCRDLEQKIRRLEIQLVGSSVNKKDKCVEYLHASQSIISVFLSFIPHFICSSLSSPLSLSPTVVRL